MLLAPFLLLWRPPKEDGGTHNKSESTTRRRERDRSLTRGDVTGDGSNAGPSAASVTAALCAVMLGSAGCNGPEAADPDPAEVVDRTIKVVVTLPRPGDTLAVVETIDSGIPRPDSPDTVRVDEGDHVWGSIFYLDSNVGKPPPSRARRDVAVTIRSRKGADMLALEPLNDSLRVLRVGDTEVMNPDSLVRAEQWGGAAIDRPFRLSVDLPRCDSVDVAVVETWLSGNENWSWVLGNLAGLGADTADTSRLASVTIRSHPTQIDTLPGCCERTLRRRAAMAQTGDRPASRAGR